jgi:hypothetical protein
MTTAREHLKSSTPSWREIERQLIAFFDSVGAEIFWDGGESHITIGLRRARISDASFDLLELSELARALETISWRTP